MNIIKNFIENKLAGYDDNIGFGFSKYHASFMPLYNIFKYSRKEQADKVGVAYGVFRTWLTEEKMVKQKQQNIREFAPLYVDEYLKKKGLGVKDPMVDELVLYSLPLLFEILECFEKLYEDKSLEGVYRRLKSAFFVTKLMDEIKDRFEKTGDKITARKLLKKWYKRLFKLAKELHDKKEPNINLGEWIGVESDTSAQQAISLTFEKLEDIYSEIERLE